MNNDLYFQRLLEYLKEWGNYVEVNSPEWRGHVVREEARFLNKTLRCVNRRTHIQVFEVPPPSTSIEVKPSRFVPRNKDLGNFDPKDKLWQVKP